MWKADVRKSWAEINLEDFCSRVGIDFASTFDQPLRLCSASSDPYPLYRWVITENRTIAFGVLHLVPPIVGDDARLWEEWFVRDEQFHHHVLRNHEHAFATDTWQGAPSDTEHPAQVLGIRWHHSNDTDLRPTKYR